MDDITKNIIRNRRLELGWTQEYAAEKAGISVATYRRIEYGVRNVKYCMILAALDAFALEQEIRPRK